MAEGAMFIANDTKVLVTGAGGFIGHHLITFLKQQGYWVRGIDQKYPEYGTTDADATRAPHIGASRTGACKGQWRIRHYRV